MLLISACVFLSLGKGTPQPWIPSVARPRNSDIIYEQEFYELDYEDVGVQTEPYDPYFQDEDEDDIDNDDEDVEIEVNKETKDIQVENDIIEITVQTESSLAELEVDEIEETQKPLLNEIASNEIPMKILIRKKKEIIICEEVQK